MQPLSRRNFLCNVGAAAFASQFSQGAARKPNVLIILADDMGYSDAGCYGGDIDTPNLDSLARNGLRFTQMYSTARCGPSRNCLMTGNYAQQNAADVMTPGNIPEWTRFAPQYMKPLGYRSYHSGKWHIRFRPVAGAGFDHSYLLQDQHRFFTPTAHYLDDEPLPPVKSESEGFYGTTAIGDHAVKTLQRHAKENAGRPFFHYLAFTSPHFPLHARQEDIDLYRDRFAEGWDTARERRHARMRRMGLIDCALSPLEADMKPSWNLTEEELLRRVGPGEVARAVPWASLTREQKEFQRVKMAIHAAMITCMDREIGRVVAQLKAMNEFDNTVILFLSDNGASAEQMIRGDGHDPSAPPGSAKTHLCLGPGWSSAANTPFRLHKSWVHEGGIASPCIVHWPAGLKDKGKLRHTPAHFIDVLPTAIELAGGKPASAHAEGAPALPGRSLLPAFPKDVRVERDFIYFHHDNNRALRVGDTKIVSVGKDRPWEMYDLKADRSETRNLAAAQPAKLKNLSQQWQEIESGFVNAREKAKPFPRNSPGLQPIRG